MNTIVQYPDRDEVFEGSVYKDMVDAYYEGKSRDTMWYRTQVRVPRQTPTPNTTPLRGPTIPLIKGKLLGPATISPCNITMDLEAIIFFMTDRLQRGPDKDVHVPSVGSPKYPSRSVNVIYL